MTRGRPAMVRLGAIVLAGTVVGFVARGWAPASWPTSAPAQPDLGAAAPPAPAGIDAGSIADRVRHHVAPDPDRPAALRARGDAYQAAFDADGFAVTVGGAELRVALRGATRGGVAIPLTPGAWRGEGDTTFRVIGTGLTERVHVRSGELEWDVVLGAAPPGRGDLELHAALGGLDRAPHPTEDGRAWRFSVDGQTLRMGELVVVDATGQEVYRALPRVAGAVLRLVVPARVLREAKYPLTVDPVVSPERAVSGLPPAPGRQESPAIAFDGTNYLVVWSDFRSPSGYEVFGTRVTPGGTLLDPAGFLVSTAPGSQATPKIAFDGTNYLVIFVDRTGNPHVSATRVAPTGTVLDPAGFTVSPPLGNPGPMAVAFGGGNYLVVWSDSSGGDDVFGARVTPSGTVLDPNSFAVSNAASSQFGPTVGFDGTNFLVVWTDFRNGNYDVFGTRVSPAGVVLDGAATGFAVSTAPDHQSFPRVDFDGTNYLVAWSDHRTDSRYSDVFATRVTPGGTVLDGAASGFAVSTAAGNQYADALAFDGVNYLVVWTDGDPFAHRADNVVAARVTPAAAVLDPTGFPVSGGPGNDFQASVAFDGVNYLVAWSDFRASGDVVGTRVTPSGAVVDSTDGFVVAAGPSPQRNPTMAFDGTNYLVVWEDDRNVDTDIYGARVTPGGTVLDPTGFRVSTSSFSEQRAPAVAFDGANYLVVWEDDRDGTANTQIFGARVTPSGTVVDAVSSGLAISRAAGAQSSPAVAFDGTNYLVAWTDSRTGSTLDIYGTRVTPGGTVLDGEFTGFAVSTAPSHQSFPAVAFDGTRYLVVWKDLRNGASNSDIYGTRVSVAGTVLDGVTTGFAVSTAPSHQSFPAVAFDGTRYLVVWKDLRNGATNSDIYGTRVGTTGAVLDGTTTGLAISDEPKNQSEPAVAANGPFLVGWRDRRGPTFDVFAARVNGGNGAVQDPTGIAIAGGPTDEQAPVVVRASGDDWTVGYQRFDATVGADRPFMRSVSPK